MMRQKFAKIGFLILFLLSILVVVEISLGKMPLIDGVTRDFVPLFSAFSYMFFRYITILGSKSFVIPFVLLFALFLYFKTKKWIPSLIFTGGVLFAHLLNVLLKGIFVRERPSIVASYDALGYSFPSGHSMIAIVCYSLVAYFLMEYVLKEKWQTAMVLSTIFLVLLIGLSRFVLNVHFLTDIIVGYFFGSTVLYLSINLAEKTKFL